MHAIICYICILYICRELIYILDDIWNRNIVCAVDSFIYSRCVVFHHPLYTPTPAENFFIYSLCDIYLFKNTIFFVFFMSILSMYQNLGCWSSVCPICGRHGNRMAVDGPQQTGVRFSLSGYLQCSRKRRRKKKKKIGKKIIIPIGLFIRVKEAGNGIRFS